MIRSMPKRILVVGTGSIGERHVRCFLQIPDTQVGICEANHATRQQVAEKYSIDGSFADLDEALSHSWDSAIVATPAPSHVPIAQQLINTGIAPLIEKPLAIDDSGIDELIASANSCGMAAGVAYVYRAHHALEEMRDAIRGGRFGSPLQVVATAGSHFPTYRPTYTQTYFTRHVSGGGAIQDALTHMLNAVEWLVGPITKLTADAAHRNLPNVTVEDTVGVLARHNEVPAIYSLNQYQAPTESIITVICESGMARFELQRHAWCCMMQPDDAWEDHPVQYETRDDWFVAQAKTWLDTLAGRSAPRCTLAEAAQTLRATRAILDVVQQNSQLQTITQNMAL